MRALEAQPKEGKLDDLLDTMLEEAPVTVSDMGNVMKQLMEQRRWRRLLQVGRRESSSTKRPFLGAYMLAFLQFSTHGCLLTGAFVQLRIWGPILHVGRSLLYIVAWKRPSYLFMRRQRCFERTAFKSV